MRDSGGIHPLYLLLLLVLLVSIAVPTLMFLRRQGEADAWEQRLRSAQLAVSGERLLQGTVQARPGERVVAEADGEEYVAYASWLAERMQPTDLPIFQTLNLEVRAARFDLVTPQGRYSVEGYPVGISDLIKMAYPGQRLVKVTDGDRVSILGEVTERDGRPGFFGEYILVTATMEEWLGALGDGPYPSMPGHW
jgi:hypothetical protein